MKTFTSKHRFARMTARKGRFVMSLVRGLPVNDALHALENSPRRAAFFIKKVLRSAIANASQDPDVNVNRLRVQRAVVDDGPLLGGRLRWRPGPQGRAMPFRKRTCHITLVVGEEMEDEAPARPTEAEGTQAADVAEETEARPKKAGKKKPGAKKAGKKKTTPKKTTAKKKTSGTKKTTGKKADTTKKAAKKKKKKQGGEE